MPPRRPPFWGLRAALGGGWDANFRELGTREAGGWEQGFREGAREKGRDASLLHTGRGTAAVRWVKRGQAGAQGLPGQGGDSPTPQG